MLVNCLFRVPSTEIVVWDRRFVDSKLNLRHVETSLQTIPMVATVFAVSRL